MADSRAASGPKPVINAARGVARIAPATTSGTAIAASDSAQPAVSAPRRLSARARASGASTTSRIVDAASMSTMKIP